MSDSRPRRHHFVPRFCLEYFTDPEGQVWTYDVAADAPRPSTASATGFEKDFHTITDDAGSPDVTIERLLADLEGAAAPVYARLIAGAPLPDSDRDIMVEFLATAFARSRRVRRSYGESYAKVMQRLLQHTARNPALFAAALADVARDQGRTFSEEERERLRADMADPRNYTFTVDREWTLQALGLLENVRPHIDAMTWTILQSSEGEFVLTDSPLSLSGPPQSGPLGFASRAAQASLALSPSCMWIGHWRRDSPARVEVGRQVVMNQNRVSAQNADRYLYAARRDDALMRFSKRWIRPSSLFELDGDDGAGLGPVSVRRSAGKDAP